MPPSDNRKTTLEVLVERIDWIKTTVERIVTQQEELREEIKEDLVNVGDLETLRANYIAADERLAAERKKEIEALRQELSLLRTDIAGIQDKYVSWVTLKWLGVVGVLILLIMLGVNRDAIITWIFKILS